MEKYKELFKSGSKLSLQGYVKILYNNILIQATNTRRHPERVVRRKRTLEEGMQMDLDLDRY